MAKIKREDTVTVLAGKDRGKKGKVLRVYPQVEKVLVEGVNVVKKHMRANRDNPKGGIVEVERPLHMSNVMFICPRCGKQSKIANKILTDGTKKRTCKKCQEVL